MANSCKLVICVFLCKNQGNIVLFIEREFMTLRDRQIGGVPLPKLQSILLQVFFTACVPTLGYQIWYPFFHIPEELWLLLAVVGMVTHMGMSPDIVPEGMERAQTWFGKYTGVSFPAGIYLKPILPLPFVLLAVRLVCGKEIYNKILWAMEGDVRVESIPLQGLAEGLTRDGALVELQWTLVLEIVNVAVFRSQTRDDTDRKTLLDTVAAEYNAQVKSSVVSQHSTEELMRGYHSGGAEVLNLWMTAAWSLEKDFGVVLARSPTTKVRILSDQVRQAWERSQGKEIFAASADALADAFAAYRRKHPDLSEELAWISFASSQGLPPGTQPPITIMKFK